MSAAPKVSVLVASYNGERFIEETVRSILGQTFRDLELIVLDDGSTDGTRAILRRLAEADARMRLIEKPNEGLIATLNRGMAEARGTYIARLDHDDVALPARIERQAALLDARPEVVAVGCLIQNVDADGTAKGKARIRHERLRHAPGAFPPVQQWLYGPTPLIRAEALRKVGGYRAKFLAAEDRDLCWRLGALGPMERLPEVLVLHREHDSNMSRLRWRTQRFSALLGDLSAIAAHFGLDDRHIVDSIEVGGDYSAPLAAYRELLAPHYPVDSYILLYQMRWEVWDVPGFPAREGMLRTVFRHLAQRPWDPVRLTLARRAILYLARKPRIAAILLPAV